MINRSISLRPQKRKPYFLIERGQTEEELISLEIQSEATRSYLDLNLTSARTILNSSSISEFWKNQNWLSLSLPNDLSLFDNKAYLALSRTNSTVSAISTENELIEKILSAAAQNKEGQKPMIKKLDDASNDSDWKNFDLWLLQGNQSILSKSSIQAFSKFVIVDDLLATGGTAKCVIDMLESKEKNVLALSVIIEISNLNGARNTGVPVYSEIKY